MRELVGRGLGSGGDELDGTVGCGHYKAFARRSFAFKGLTDRRARPTRFGVRPAGTPLRGTRPGVSRSGQVPGS
ncbi:hypothetical protein GCM10027162_61710 [Streptomyces incanus]